MKKILAYLVCSLGLGLLLSVRPVQGEELVYGEMEFPLSFVSQARDYTFNPLSRFLTDIEGRLIELTCDPLVDIYQKAEGQTHYRPGLATWRTMSLRQRKVLSFTLTPFSWVDKRRITFEDVHFALQYRQLSEESWEGCRDLVLEKRGPYSFDVYLGNNPMKFPVPGQLYFPLINPRVFRRTTPISQAKIDKQKQRAIGAGRYRITRVVEHTSITMERRPEHPYFQGLDDRQGHWIDVIRMHAFPKARINRNEQFIEGRIQLITTATQPDLDYILNAYPQAKVVKYSDDSFSGFTFNCAYPYLAPAALRRAFNYLFRKELALKKALGGEGELISGPLPRRSFFYNLNVPPYEDNQAKGVFLFKAYFQFGLELIEKEKGLVVTRNLFPADDRDLQSGDVILEVGRRKHKIKDLLSFQKALAAVADKPQVRIRVARKDRRLWVHFATKPVQHKGLLSNIHVTDGKIVGLPPLALIANNPEGKSPLIKEICGALKEDLAKVGITVQLDYLAPHEYYPRLRQGDFALAYRTLKLTGTPNLQRLYTYDPQQDKITNVNYGRYYNARINALARKVKDVTHVPTLEAVWRMAHRILHDDPPQLFLWSSRHILIYDPHLVVITPGSNYKIPHGYKTINGLINIFNEVHLWRWKQEND